MSVRDLPRIRCSVCDENARKVEHTVLIAMFDKYRAQVIARSCPILMKLIQVRMEDPDQILVRIPRRDLEARSRGEIPRRDPETRSRDEIPMESTGAGPRVSLIERVL